MSEEYIKLTDEEIEKQYALIKQYHEKFLKKYGVRLSSLRKRNGNYTSNALVLIYLSLGYPKTRKVSKKEITRFVREYYPDANDVQQARHLGAQDGWYILAGGRDNIVGKVGFAEYWLYSLEEPYPHFTKGHRITDAKDWDEIKKFYNYRCATCGSQEGKANFNWPATKTKLQKAHMNPNKPLVAGNIIPQCQKCNRADRNRWVYDEKGRVIKLAKANFVKNFDKDVRYKIYKILKKEFEK